MNDKLDVVNIQLKKNRKLLCDYPLNSPKDVVRFLGSKMCDLDREVLCVVNFQTDGRPINLNVISIGSIDCSIYHPREVFKSAILSNAASIMILHNHPSGNLHPSSADIQTTDRLLKNSKMMGIYLLDHIIVGGHKEEYFSFRENGYINFAYTPVFTEKLNELDRSEFASVNYGNDSLYSEQTSQIVAEQINRAVRRRGR